MMTNAQFRRLAVVYWKTATAEQLAASFREFQRALSGVPEHALDHAIDRHIADGDKMPTPAGLRALAASDIASPGGNMVRCIDCDAHKRVTFMPRFTPCPVCMANAKPQSRSWVFPQGTLREADGYIAHCEDQARTGTEPMPFFEWRETCPDTPLTEPTR